MKSAKAEANYEALLLTHEALLLKKQEADTEILELQGKLQQANSTVTQLKELRNDEFYSDEEDMLKQLKEQNESLQYELQVRSCRFY